MIKIQVAQTPDDIQQALFVRGAVFCEGQNIDYVLDRDGLDAQAIHILGKVGDEPVAAGRIRIEDGKAKLERIAVRNRWRGNGYGELLTLYMVQASEERGAHVIYMHAQSYLEKFYEKLGFRRCGNYFEEAAISHCEMERVCSSVPRS